MPARLTLRSNIPGLEERLDYVIGSLSRFDVPVSGPHGGAPQSLWDLIARDWRTSRLRMFATLGRDTESPWPTYEQTAEREFYAHWKRGVLGAVRGPWRTELRWPETDRIFRGLTEPGNPYYVDARTPTTIELGTSLPYAYQHDRGVGRAPPRLGGHAIPRRPLTRLGRWLTQSIERDLVDYADDIGASIGAPLTGAQARLLPLRRG